MADANAAVAPPPPPPPGWRSIAAELVASRYALAAAAVAAIIYLVLGMDWVLFASLGVWRVGRAACAESCAAVAAADGVSSFAMVSLVVLALVTIAAAVCSFFVSCNTEDEIVAPTNDLIPPEDQPVLLVLLLGMLALMAFVLVTVLGFLVKAFSPFRGSQTDGFGSLIVDVGVLCIVLLNCFIVVPALALFVWKRILVIWQRI